MSEVYGKIEKEKPLDEKKIFAKIIKEADSKKPNENNNSNSEKIIKALDNNSNSEKIIFPENYDLTNKDNMDTYVNYYLKSFKENFELLEYIDSGSTGIVYKGRSLPGGNNQNFSFKFCIDLKKNKKHRKNKYHEIINQKILHHINISQILAFYKIEDNSFFSVSEFGKFGNIDNFLHKFLKRSYLSETFINYLSKPILEGLNYMRKKNIFHMDIKKGNIVLDADINPKLIDFSSCISFANYDPNKKIKLSKIGTGRYMSPELLGCKEIEIKYADKADVYSFGITIYNLAFGSYPYGLNEVKGDDYVAIYQKLKEAHLEIPRDFEISEKFKDFLKHVLELDYTNRYSVKDALNDPWIKGWDIINDDKENTGIQENFIIRLISDNIPRFNEYIK